MKERDQLVLRALMLVLNRMDQCEETVLHHAMGQLVPDLLWAETTMALKLAEQNQWCLGVKSLFQTNKWSLSDKGRAAALQM
jgi:hypothetical protein